MKRIYSPLYFFDLVFGLTKEKKEMDALSAKLRNYTDEVSICAKYSMPTNNLHKLQR